MPVLVRHSVIRFSIPPDSRDYVGSMSGMKAVSKYGVGFPTLFSFVMWQKTDIYKLKHERKSP